MDLIQVHLDGFWKFSLYNGLCRISFLSSFWGKPWMHYLSLSRTTFDNLWWQAHTELCEEADTMAAKIRTAMYSQKQRESIKEYEVHEVLSRWAVCQSSIFETVGCTKESRKFLDKQAKPMHPMQPCRFNCESLWSLHATVLSKTAPEHSRTTDQLRTRESWGLSTLNISKFKLLSYNLRELNVFWVEICLICGNSVPSDHALIL